ncbi:PREDICTED: myotubularin-related protein 10-B-like [Amphimedon queenslandica]|nr:PREDICTED: myotubularin-related protein 10-B-like [Amphimedon queenslandica]|eukprot:XP_019856165.1 PREDICTED: myotubularin-related protein 10-B-like [Amphimedon queenslandica]
MAKTSKAATLPTVSVPDSSIDLLPGEALVGHAPDTQQLLYESEGPDKSPGYIYGTLYITNHRLSFKPAPFNTDKLSPLDRSSVVKSHYIPLRLILQAYTISSNKKRLVTAKSTLPKKINELEIICKDLRKVVFSFKSCSKSDVVHVVNSFGMYSSPSSVFHLFAFDYARVVHKTKDTHSSSSSSSQDVIPTYFNPRDWQKELDRLGVNQKQWRVTEANQHFLLCDSLPPYIVVPYNISDDTLEYAAGLHFKNRLPVWCWSHSVTGVSLTRGSLPDEDRLEAPDPSYMYAVAMARNLEVQVENKLVRQYRVQEYVAATAREIQTAYSKLMEVCTISTCHDLARADQKWLATLDSSHWLHYVKSCLSLASDIVKTLCEKRTSCVLLDQNDRDLACVISSLVQIMADPHYRTISGFESLVQKEWVAMGHPFTTRSGLITDAPSNEELVPDGQAPVFVLFCDCVWQLTVQFPSAFQFTPSFLVKFVSLTASSIYSNFVFDSAKARVEASNHSKRSSYYVSQLVDLQSSHSDAEKYEGPLVSAWGKWRSSLTAEETENWLNPFYYIFGSGDAHNEFTFTGNLLPFESSVFNLLFSDMLPDKTSGGNFGLYSDQPLPLPLSSHELTPERAEQVSLHSISSSSPSPLLLPNTAMPSLVFWADYFFRFIPDYSSTKLTVSNSQQLQSKLVKEVRKLKEALNDLELERGEQTSDFSRFIREIMKARDEEKRLRKLKRDASHEIARRMSAFITMSSEDEDCDRSLDKLNSPVGSVHDKAKTLPAKLDDSLSKFADELHNNGEVAKRFLTASTGGTGGRSPVLKTKITIQKEDSSQNPLSPASRWLGASQLTPPTANSPIMPSPPITMHKKMIGTVMEGGNSQDHELIDL